MPSSKKPVCHFEDMTFYTVSGGKAVLAAFYGVADHPRISSFDARHCINSSPIVHVKYSKDRSRVAEVVTLNTVYRNILDARRKR